MDGCASKANFQRSSGIFMQVLWICTWGTHSSSMSIAVLRYSIPKNRRHLSGICERLLWRTVILLLYNRENLSSVSLGETIAVPDERVGRVEGRISRGKLGIIVHSTARPDHGKRNLFPE